MNTTSIARKLAAVVLAATATFTTMTVTSSSAQAAVPANGTAKICFRAPTVVGGYGPYNRSVFVDAWINNTWTQIGTVTPNVNGCLSQPLQSGYHWRFRVYHHEASMWWLGTSGYAYIQTGYTYNYGTLTLQTTRG